MLKISNILEKHVTDAIGLAFPKEMQESIAFGEPLSPSLCPATNPDFGDFQINGALTLAKTIKQSPRVIAQEIITRLEINTEFMKLCTPPALAGPGMWNESVCFPFLKRKAISNAYISGLRWS